MAEKRQPPLWLDMSFTEAVERFVGADPAEVTESVEAERAKKRSSQHPKPKKEGRAPRKGARPA